MKKSIFNKIRLAYYNYFLLGTVSKKCVFGRGFKVEGRVYFSDHVYIDDNVEIRNRTNSESFIGAYTTFNRNTVVRGKFHIGSYCSIAPNCMIIGANHVFKDRQRLIREQGVDTNGIIIEDDVWIGANSVILDGVTIGKGTVIGAGSVVTKSIPPYSIAVGNPCKVIKQR